MKRNTAIVTFEVLGSEEYKKSIEIKYGFHPSPFGQVLIGVTERGICHLNFVKNTTEVLAFEELEKRWRHTLIRKDHSYTATLVNSIFEKNDKVSERKFHLLMKGTDFQIEVWKALMLIPEGTTQCYEDIAVTVGKPKAVRAAASAIGANPICYLIPCHRVISKTGKIHKFSCGADIKKALLECESVKIEMD